MANRYLLGFDVGSSSVKASLVNADSGKCVASAFYPEKEAPIMAVKAGWAEQDPNSWWEYAKLSLKKIMSDAGATAEDIKAQQAREIAQGRQGGVLFACRQPCPLDNRSGLRAYQGMTPVSDED